MNRYTIQQRIEIVKIHYKNGENFSKTVRKVRASFGRYDAPARSTIVDLINKFEHLGQVTDVKTPTRARSARSAKNISAAVENVEENSRLSIARRSQELGISESSLQRILHNDLGLKAYKIQLTHQIKPRDHEQRRLFIDWVLEMQRNDPSFFKKIILSDEAHFHLHGYVNRQNCRIWGSENPNAIVEKPVYPQRVTVWCAFWAGGVIGPYFFENDAAVSVTVNGLRYRKMITDFFWPEVEGKDTENFYFQQDGATCHTNRETITLLQSMFPGRVISRNGDFNWPPRSCDLSPLDFFLWGYLKDRVYASRPTTVEHLKDNIRSEIRCINSEMCENVMENFLKRMTICKKSRGGHLLDIVFHI